MSPYHAGELAAQELAGEAAVAVRSANAIRAELPAVAQQFLREQPLLVVGAADAAGDVWATMLTGPPGFLQPVDARTLDVRAAPTAQDPLAAALGAALPVGAIAVEPATRRRVRLNGRASPLPGGGFRLGLEQVVSNCPKYIQARTPEPVAAGAPAPARRGSALDAATAAAVRAADTFFVATHHPTDGVDASHRGGTPGFLEVLGPSLLRWPEYAGNGMFLTLGNLLVDDRAGLLVPDWATGGLLLLSGSARVDFDPGAREGIPGARSIVEFAVSAVVELPRAAPLRWSAPEAHRFNPPARVPAPA